MLSRRVAKQKEREGELAYARHVKEEVVREAERDAERRSLREATHRQQQHYLNEQVTLQRDQAARDPGASVMTQLEATLNRGLLVSLVQHKYPHPHPLN